MKRSFTFLTAVLCLVSASSNSFGQCLTGGSFTAGTTNIFELSTEGFSGAFVWSANGSGQLESTPVSAGQVKELRTSTLFLPNTATSLAWSFNLSGTANVVSYIVEALYATPSGIAKVPVCSGASLTTVGSELIFAAVAPSEIIGQSFQLMITFTSTSTGAKLLAVDNFKTNALNSTIILPVTITYFNVAASSGKVKLTWLVASELNVNRYEVERSSNGKTFTKIGSVAATALVTYTYLDATFSTGSNYYRLKAVDNDGKFKYSSVVLYKVGKSGISLRTYPSPATSEVTVQYDPGTEVSEFSVLSASGQVVKTVKTVPGKSETTIDISTLTKGIYFIRYSNAAGEIESAKLIKQ
jgi:hypothetical protein